MVRARNVPRKGYTQKKAAEVLDVSSGTVARWLKEGRLSYLPDGSVDPDSLKSPESEVKKPGRKPLEETNPKVSDLYSERARLEKAKADRAELLYEVDRGRLIDKMSTENTITEAFGLVREGVRDATERLSAIMSTRYSLPEPELRELIGLHMHESLETLADELEARRNV